MLPVRPAPNALTEDALVDELISFARANLTVWVSYDTDALLRERIKSGIARARSHGFESRSSVATFVTLMLRFCPNFDRHPAVVPLLERRDLSCEARVDLLFTSLTAEQWVDIEETYDPAEWQAYATGPVL